MTAGVLPLRLSTVGEERHPMDVEVNREIPVPGSLPTTRCPGFCRVRTLQGLRPGPGRGRSDPELVGELETFGVQGVGTSTLSVLVGADAGPDAL